MANVRQKMAEWFSALKTEGFSNKLKQRVLGSIVLLALAVIVVPLFFSHNQSKDDPIKLSSRIPVAPPKPKVEFAPPPEADTSGASISKPPSLPNNPNASSTTQAPIVSQDAPVAQANVAAAPAQNVSTSSQLVSATPGSVQTLNSQLIPDSGNSANTSQVDNTAAQPATSVAGASTPSATATTVAPATNAASPNTVVSSPASTTPSTVSAATQTAPKEKLTPVSSSQPATNKKLNANNNHQKKVLTANKKTKHNLKVAEAWAIQLGTFSNKANALELIKKLRAQGYSAYMHESNATQGKLIRVYVGPEIKRNDAQVMMERLNKLFNLNGMVVKYKI